MKIIGFKDREIKLEVKSILEKAINFPPEWQQIELLITGKE